MIFNFVSITILLIAYYTVSRFFGTYFLIATNTTWHRDSEFYAIVWVPGTGEIFFLFLIWLLMVLIIDTRTSALAHSISNRFSCYV